jgi:hypothetical protein
VRRDELARAEGMIDAARSEATAPRPIAAEPYRLRDTATIEPRDWLYKRLFIRGYVTATIAPGAGAKTQITLVDGVAMACGFDLASREPLRRGPLRVWYVNLEDDRDEIDRRIAAICQHYGVTDADLGDRLHVDTDREGRYVIVETMAYGPVVRGIVVDAIVAQVREHGIDLLVLDPFVGTHRVSENDNSEMNRLVSFLRRVAEEGRCGVHVLHHVRKGANGEGVTAEDGRGASAIKDACRAIRTLTPMSEKEAADYGIPVDRRRFFVWANPAGKPNLAPPADVREWFELVDVGLGNGTDVLDEDRIGVPVRWRPPGAFDEVSLDDCRRIWAAIGRASDGEVRVDPRAAGYVGKLICTTLGWSWNDGAAAAQAKRMAETWIRDGVLVEYRFKDTRAGRDVACLKLGPAVMGRLV